MNHMPTQNDALAELGPQAGAEVFSAAATGSAPAVSRLRAVHRAVAELKRGVPVLLEAAPGLVVLPAETAGAPGLADFAALAQPGAVVLLLASGRAGAIQAGQKAAGEGGIRAVRMEPALLDPAVLRGLADPTAEQLLPQPPRLCAVPEAAAPALALAKLARLLPAMLAAPCRAGAAASAKALGLLSVQADDVLHYPMASAAGLVRVAEARVPLEGVPDARVVAFRSPDLGVEHLAILVGRPESAVEPLVRIHSECFTGDLLGSLRCDCGPQLRGAICRMAEEGSGVLLYLAQEGRGIGLVNKLRAYALQDAGLDTVDANYALGWGADERNYLMAATMLAELGIGAVRLLTNNPGKVAALAACGVTVRREHHAFAPNGVNDVYLATKAERFGHLLDGE
jgi:GTP cyclohydrolase II